MTFKEPAIPAFTGGIKVVITLIAHKQREKSVFDVTQPTELQFNTQKWEYYHLHNFGYLVGEYLFTLNYMFQPTCSHLQDIQTVQERDMNFSYVIFMFGN